MIFRLGELFCGPGGLACGAKMSGSIMANGEEYAIRHAGATGYDPSTCRTYSHNICGAGNAKSVVSAEKRA